MKPFAALLAVLVVAFSSPGAEKASSPIGRKAAPFELKDYRGKRYTLDSFKDYKILVVAFLGTECPLAKLYGSRLAKLADEFEKRGVGFVGINSNTQDSITEIAAHARRHGIKFPVLKDLGNRVADQLGAVRTPEVFVLDSERIVRYWGRIDDQYGVDYVRDAPKQHDLRRALEELLAGKQVSRSVTEAPGCFIGRIPKPKADSKVTYARHIAPILQKRCVECHREGEIAPFSLTDYDEVVGWAETIAEVVREQRMPPWHASPKHGKFLNDRRLSDEEKQLIYEWVAGGAPEGDKSDLPKPRTFVQGWQLPRKPDLVLNITEKPFKVQAEGAVRYQYFRVDPGFKEDKWIKAAELLPGNRAVVHHILAFAREPGQRLGGGAQGFLVGYVPGLRVIPFPDGMAKRIPAGAELIFQMHYTPIGSVQFDQSKIGFVFADPNEVKYEVITTAAFQRYLNIPPGEANYTTTAQSRLSLDGTYLLSMMPHMHLRGKAFRYEAEFENGKREVLLDIPRYDFNWQTAYRLAEPRKLTGKVRIHCTAVYDNSENNLNNPDPSKRVRWGDQTWDEMMIGYFDIAVPLGKRAELSPMPETPESRARGYIVRFDKNGDGKIQRTEVPEQLLRTFDAIDKNKDKVLTLEEMVSVLKRLP
ncbi:MAG: thiol-disulfide isomerase [Gemmatales bacterium]|nr:MAG: thiol-disulfide isomerase [Gemmatales bacterium]